MSERSEAARPVLVAQQDAIFDYLDALLREIPEEYPEPAPAAVAAPAAAEEIQEWDPQALVEPTPVQPAVQPAPAVAPKPVVAPKPPVAPVVAPVVAEPVAEPPPVAEPVPAPAPEPIVAAASAPAWAEPEFQALLFQVGGLKLAVPLIKLHSVLPWSEQVTPMPNQPDWCHGLFRYRERNVRVVDTATMVLPPDKRDPALERNHILVLGDGAWGLSCSRIGDVIKLRPEQVKWRGAAGQRPWLAGTVLDHLCALLDTEAFAAMLAQKQ